jgi:Fibronectin type III domain
VSAPSPQTLGGVSYSFRSWSDGGAQSHTVVAPATAATYTATYAATSPPPAPTGLAATPGNTQVALVWNASAGATSYRVKRATVSGGPYITIASPTSTTYTNTGLTNGTTYYYVVSAVNAGGESVNSAQVSATPQLPPPPPPKPSGLNATPGNAQVVLTWTASSGATSYRVKRATVSGGPYTVIASPMTNSYTNTGLTNGTTYYYVVSAVNAGGESANSDQKSATPDVANVMKYLEAVREVSEQSRNWLLGEWATSGACSPGSSLPQTSPKAGASIVSARRTERADTRAVGGDMQNARHPRASPLPCRDIAVIHIASNTDKSHKNAAKTKKERAAFIRRPMHDGQKPLPLQLNATKRVSPQSPQRGRAKPRQRSPQST